LEVNSKIVGFNISTPNREIVYDIINTLKLRSPGLVVIVGGPHATCLPQDVIKFSNADGVVLGEGEETVLKVIRNLPTLTSFQGFYTRDDVLKNIRPLKLSPRISNLDSLPYPAYDLINIHKYLSIKQELFLMSGRGCYHDCAFCCARRQYGRHIESRTSKSVINEIKFLKSKYNVDNYYFFNENLLKWSFVNSFCESIKGEKIKWGAQARINDLDTFLIPRLVASGCNNLGFGLESGSEEIQSYIGKKINKDIFSKFEALSKEGINTRGYFVIGLPDENHFSLIETAKFIIKLKMSGLNDIVIFPARVYPGTRLYEDLLRKYGQSKSNIIISSQYLDDYKHKDNKYLKEKFKRYNVLPTFKICNNFENREIRIISEIMYYIFKYADQFINVSDKYLHSYIFNHQSLAT
jgi:radical SAM superfamily enzyme YgiQ (UPF0313 family)